jgi:L-serine dehydratase
MKYRSVFDIIGPIMVGPSSSHTAGPVRIGQIARKLFEKEPKSVIVRLYGSFAETYKGHASDVAVIGGILDYSTDDPRIPDSLEYAKEKGLEVTFIREDAVPTHPNTLKLTLNADNETMDITGISIGGGLVQITEIDGFPLRLSGENPAMMIFHKDIYGTIACVAGILAKNEINISGMEVSRREKGNIALMAIETDSIVPEGVAHEIADRENILRVIQLNE